MHGERGGPVGRAVAQAQVAVVQLDLDQPPDQQLPGRERRQAGHPDRIPPGLAGQLAGDGAQRHRRGRHIGHQLGGLLAGGLLDVSRHGRRTHVRRPVLPVSRADHQAAHRVGAAGQVREHVRPRPARQQRRCPQVRLGDDPRRAEQPLGGVVELVPQPSLRGVHCGQGSAPRGSPGSRAGRGSSVRGRRTGTRGCRRGTAGSGPAAAARTSSACGRGPWCRRWRR